MTAEERLKQDGVEGAPILFYSPRYQWGEFSNFFSSKIILPNPFNGELVTYATGEHRYQAMKATTYDAHMQVAKATYPGKNGATEAKRLGNAVQLRDGWGDNYGDLCWYVMFETVLAKFMQNDNLASRLLYTGDCHIYEDSPTDDIWGWRYSADHRGKNLLGRCLMDVRKVLSDA